VIGTRSEGAEFCSLVSIVDEVLPGPGGSVAKTHKVTLKKSGLTIDVAEDEYILEAAEDAGLSLPYDCRSGTCTTCIQRCLEGEIDQEMAFAIDDEELEQGLRLICIGSPLSDVVLEA
jgi:ferredoxin